MTGARGEGYHAAMRFRRLAFALATGATASAALLAGAPQPQPAAPALPLRIIVAASREQAQRLLARVRRGEDFIAIARAESIDPSAVDGGLLGRVDASLLRPDLQNALRGVSAGGLTTIVQVPTGFAFLRVEPAASRGAPTRPISQALLATGTVKYVVDVGGLPEAETVLREFPKPSNW